MDILILYIQHMENLSICCMDKLSICHIEKYMSYDTEKNHNESVGMTYLRKIYTNIALIGHNISFTERQNLPYSVMLGFTPPWNIVMTTKCSVWGSSSVFIKSKIFDNSNQNNYSP